MGQAYLTLCYRRVYVERQPHAIQKWRLVLLNGAVSWYCLWYFINPFLPFCIILFFPITFNDQRMIIQHGRYYYEKSHHFKSHGNHTYWSFSIYYLHLKVLCDSFSRQSVLFGKYFMGCVCDSSICNWYLTFY